MEVVFKNYFYTETARFKVLIGLLMLVVFAAQYIMKCLLLENFSNNFVVI